MAQPVEAQENPLERLRSYPFHTDPEFANGLSTILGHPDTPATEAEINREDDLVLQAKCFFFSRKENLNPPIDFAAYKSWLAAQLTEAPRDSEIVSGSSQTPTTSSSSEPIQPGPQAPTNPEPAYPSSFAHIVDLITTGQPIPGIQEIPDTVLEGHDLSSEKPRRRKPWEREESADIAEDSTSAAP
ncbi:hypothetical protein N7474_001483 [Penicillium riverlandense]|uniref:uncharacterized protein n=1 Tax=Penicillium riverlandense TaxID=1903569 RepID=UPI002547CF3A|nr:uncharacterized protein N7474_001483 [Penicillium riverlandense]KAJ5833172.1 hypothetical protein N7474_001483 [Penicillium riverlandense]